MRIVDNYRTVWPLLRRYRRGFARGMVFLLVTNFFTFLSPWILKLAVDDLQGAISPGRILLYASLILGAALVQGIFRFAMRRTLIGMSRDVEYDLRSTLLDHLLRLPLAFFQGMRTGDIMSRSTSDVEAVRMAVGPGAMHLANTTVTFLIALASMLSLHPPLTALAFMPMPLVAFLMYLSARFYHARYLAVQQQSARLNASVQETFSGMRVVKAYAQEGFQRQRFVEENGEFMRRNLSLARSLGFFHPAVAAVAGSGTLILLWAGGRLIIEGQITLGTLVAFMGFFSLLIWPTIALGWVITLVQRGSAALGRINELLSSPAEPPSPADKGGLEGEGGLSLEAKNLAFAYPGSGGTVLQGISFALRAGDKVALVGRTGSGKSTLLQLMGKLWPVDGNMLFVEGRDVNSLSPHSLRRSIGFVPQETFLFSRSLAENIALDDGTDEDELRRNLDAAALASHLKGDAAELPEGLETVVGERGVTLSGGQKQRTAIARALLRSPRLLILDDALSAVDAETEEKILDELFSAGKERTVVMVSHRLSTIMRARRILVLDEGRLVEEGTHEELLAAPTGVYRRLVERQIIADELAREAP